MRLCPKLDNLSTSSRRSVPPALTDQQAEALDAIRAAQGFAPFLLHGVTGSGKTEVYLHALAALLDARPDAQALVLVPEINLTPQFEAAFRARFAGTPRRRRSSRCTAGSPKANARATGSPHTGRAHRARHAAGGARVAADARLIVVDEEHEPAYKQQEGLRYSARDLAVWRAKHLGIPVVLGSATPSLELVAGRAGPLHAAHAVAPRGGRCDAADRAPDRSRRGAAARAALDGRTLRRSSRR
jgi:primosomal protein N' (replication factor Y)